MPAWAEERWPAKKGTKFMIGKVDNEDRERLGTYIVDPNSFAWEEVRLFMKVEQGKAKLPRWHL